MRRTTFLLLLCLGAALWAQEGKGGAVDLALLRNYDSLATVDLQSALTGAFWGAFESNLENRALEKRVEELTELNATLSEDAKKVSRAAYWWKIGAVIEAFLLLAALAVARSRITVVKRRR